MVLPFKNSMPGCPRNQHCWKWAQTYMGYCLCSVNDGISLSLGLISVISWGVAEIPQIITNYKEKSTEGLSVAFLTTWILGDLFNLFGCMLEPATLPTQYYMAVLYTLTTMILFAQSIYYGHIYPQLKWDQRYHKDLKASQIQERGKGGESNKCVGVNQVKSSDRWRIGSTTIDQGGILSSPIPLPAAPLSSSPGRELYYMSARSLSKSYTPTGGSFLAQKMSPTSSPVCRSIEEPLLRGNDLTQSSPVSGTKPMLCLISGITLLGTFSLQRSAHMAFEGMDQGYVMHSGRKLLQVSQGLLKGNDIAGSGGIGSFLGWAMAAIYMGGRLPQICLNIKRGNVQGLNPFMFIFALVGNATYIASILVNSLDWSRIGPNLPWLVDAGGCVLLDTFILIQFIYFRYWAPQDADDKQGSIIAV